MFEPTFPSYVKITECVTDSYYQPEMMIIKSLLKQVTYFEAGGAIIKIALSLKLNNNKQPS